MIEKDHGIVLRISAFSSTSHIVTWLTNQHGKLTTIVKGAIRPKSIFLGQYDLFYTCELLYYIKARNNLHILRECSTLNSRCTFRNNWKAYSSASYICDFISRIIRSGSQENEIFKFTSCSLDFLCLNNIKPQFLFWFELKLLNIMGMAPLLSKCTACLKHIANNNSAFFSPSKGGVFCSTCLSAIKKPKITKLSLIQNINHLERYSSDLIVIVTADIMAMLKKWQNSNSPRSAQNTKCTTAQITAFQALIGLFLYYHLESIPKSRNIAIKMINL